MSLFCNALPEITRKKISGDLNCHRIEDLKWNKETSNYFITVLGLNSKFELKEDKIENELIGTAMTFEKPDFSFKSLKEYQAGVFILFMNI